jgi:proline dehydrogenase
MGLARRVLLWASRNEWLGQQFQQRAFTRRAASRFIPGETLDAALNAARSFEPHSISNLLTLLGENVTNESDATLIAQQYVHALERIQVAGLDCQVSVKPTQLGMDVGQEICTRQLVTLAAAAAKGKNLVWVDMEGSSYVQPTLDLVTAVRQKHENVGVCIQAYLHRSAADLEQLLESRTPVRLVKGAYKERAGIAIQKKKDVDSNYLTLATRMIKGLAEDEGGFPGFGTHDITLIEQIRQIASREKVRRDRFEFEMLFGIGGEYQRRIASEGYGMRVLISYGTSWFPWYMRRLAERPANVWFVLRNLVSR